MQKLNEKAVETENSDQHRYEELKSVIEPSHDIPDRGSISYTEGNMREDKRGEITERRRFIETYERIFEEESKKGQI